MKKFCLSVILALAMTMSLTGCSQTPKQEPAKTGDTMSGVFTGTSTGMQGPVSVQLTVEEGKITKAEVTECHETAGLSDVALERIPSQIVEHQTFDLDTVTGATLCSNALMRAAEDAATNAGMDLSALKANAYHAAAGEAETLSADVVVVGGGGRLKGHPD